MSLRCPDRDPDEVPDNDVLWLWRLYDAEEPGPAHVAQGVTIVPADTMASSVFTLPQAQAIEAGS